MSRAISDRTSPEEHPAGESQNTENEPTLCLRDPSGDDTAAIVAEFLRTAHLMRCLLSSHFADFGLTDMWFSVLEILSRSAPEGCSQVELATELEQSESSVSTLIERMRSHGLLYRLRSKTDRRKHLLLMTERGQALCSVVREHHRQRTAHLLGGFRTTELETFSKLLNRLRTELAQIKFAHNADDLPEATMLRMSDSGPPPAAHDQAAHRNPAA